MDGIIYLPLVVLGIVALIWIFGSLLAAWTDTLDLPEPLGTIAKIPGLIVGLIDEMTKKW